MPLGQCQLFNTQANEELEWLPLVPWAKNCSRRQAGCSQLMPVDEGKAVVEVCDWKPAHPAGKEEPALFCRHGQDPVTVLRQRGLPTFLYSSW